MTNSPLRPTSTSTPDARSSVAATRWVLVLVAMVLTACSGDRPDRDLSFGPTEDPVSAVAPRPRPPGPPPPPDTRGVELAAVGGTDPTPTPVEIEGGEATLSGSLAFAGEPVAGATVRLERWVDGRMNWIELQTSEAGGWMAEEILGGRYVIRAWKGDRLALSQASAVFLAEDEARQVHLAMAELGPPPSSGDVEEADADAEIVDDEEDPDDEGTGDEPADDEAEADPDDDVADDGDADAEGDGDAGDGGSANRSGRDGGVSPSGRDGGGAS